MRIVADTNVVVSGLLWLGHSGRVLEAAANGRLTLYTSPILVAELRNTLQYPRLAQRVERSGLTLDELIARYTNVAIVVQPATLPRIVRDPDDDHVLACALAAQAELIVSGDKDLLTLESFEQIPIVTAAEAMQRIEAAQK
jgi:putative PIN family toxin of toxin-antitoxin system